MRILIVDDHREFRQLVRMLIPSGDVEFMECEDGQDAVAQYPCFRPDIVLMDIAMKRMDGLDATARITALYPGARILMLTQYDDSDLRQAAREAGACGYLTKEDLSQLHAHIQAQLPPLP